MKFFQTIRSSLYDPAFYRRMKEASAAQAVKYFALIVFIISLATTAWLGVSFSLWASTTGDLREWRDTALSLYPDELVLEYRDGRVSSNVEEPYAIPFPEGFLENAGAPGKAGGPQPNLLVISTKYPVALDDFDRYDTMAILAEDSIWINNVRDGKIEVQKFDDRNQLSFTIDKERAVGYMDKAFSILKPFMAVFFVLLPFLLFAVLMTGHLVYLVFGACIIWVVGKMRNTDLTYGQSYKLGLYLMTAPVLYGLFSTVIPHANIPFLFTLILAVFAYMNLVPDKEDQPLADNGPKTDLQEIPTPAPIEGPAGVSGEMKTNPVKSDAPDAETDNKPTDGK